MKRLILLCVLLTSTQVFAEFERVIIHNAYGCESEADHSKLTNFAVSGDNEALTNLLASKIKTGECNLFIPNDIVYQSESKVFSGIVKIRKKGELRGYWTNIEYVKDSIAPVQQKPIEQKSQQIENKTQTAIEQPKQDIEQKQVEPSKQESISVVQDVKPKHKYNMNPNANLRHCLDVVGNPVAFDKCLNR